MKKCVWCAVLALFICCVFSPLVGAAEVNEKVKIFVIDDARRKLAGEPVDYISGEYSTLRNAGFSDVEIRQFMRPILEEANFTPEQLKKYFNLYDPLYTGREIDRIEEQKESIENLLN